MWAASEILWYQGLIFCYIIWQIDYEQMSLTKEKSTSLEKVTIIDTYITLLISCSSVSQRVYSKFNFQEFNSELHDCRKLIYTIKEQSSCFVILQVC